MKPYALSVLGFLCSLSILAAESSPKEDVINAAKQLGEKPNYSWRQTVKVPQSAQFRPGPTNGKTEKGGATVLNMTFGDNDVQAVIVGDKVVANGQDGWQTAAEMENAEGPARFMARRLRGFKAPADQAAEIANQVKELKKDGEAYTGELTKEGATALASFRGRSGGGGPEVSGAKGNVKFWIKDGLLMKYEYHVEGTMSFNGNDIDLNRTTTIEIKDVGSTKADVPEAAKKKLG